jgi:hypothetical protein
MPADVVTDRLYVAIQAGDAALTPEDVQAIAEGDQAGTDAARLKFACAAAEYYYGEPVDALDALDALDRMLAANEDAQALLGTQVANAAIGECAGEDDDFLVSLAAAHIEDASAKLESRGVPTNAYVAAFNAALDREFGRRSASSWMPAPRPRTRRSSPRPRSARRGALGRRRGSRRSAASSRGDPDDRGEGDPEPVGPAAVGAL